MLHKNNKKQTDPNLSKETEQEDCCVSSENELAQLQSAFEQAQNKYLRVLADYQNLQKRVEDDRFNMVFFANEKLFKKLLPIYDDLQRANEHISDAGLTSVIDNFKKMLTEFNVIQMEIILEKTDFDSNLHEAIETCVGPNKKIMKLYRNGYLLNDKVIQTAIVAVGNKSNN